MMNLTSQNNKVHSKDNTGRMPVLFVGHGSPMYVIEDNEFTQKWQNLGKTIQTPKAIICISAHWETRGTYVTAMQKPPTIHDFGGFPGELYDIQYPVSGSPELAHEIINAVHNSDVHPDDKWGLDHGAWSVIRRMYPEAEIPVIQLSLDYNKSPKEHYELAKELTSFRDKGVLIIGSGNMVHNLHKIAWDKEDNEEYGFEWALEANEIFKKSIQSNNYKELINYELLGKAVQMAVPTPDHFLPLLYALALKNENEEITIFNDKAVMGSLTMTSLKIG
jgi:4,5-DOPA dioxygenase extradiol